MICRKDAHSTSFWKLDVLQFGLDWHDDTGVRDLFSIQLLTFNPVNIFKYLIDNTLDWIMSRCFAMSLFRLFRRFSSLFPRRTRHVRFNSSNIARPNSNILSYLADQKTRVSLPERMWRKSGWSVISWWPIQFDQANRWMSCKFRCAVCRLSTTFCLQVQFER